MHRLSEGEKTSPASPNYSDKVRLMASRCGLQVAWRSRPIIRFVFFNSTEKEEAKLGSLLFFVSTSNAQY
jgi:hypothetical protein